MITLFLGLENLIPNILRLLGAVLCNLIYLLIATLFQVFMTVSRLNILEEGQIEPIYQRVTLILTIVMVFYITFEFVKYVVQPDGISDKEKGVGNIAKKLILVVVMLAFVPKIFTLAMDLQDKIITNQVFSKVILGRKEDNFSNFGNKFAADMIMQFYRIDEEVCPSVSSDPCSGANDDVESVLERFRTKGLLNLTKGLNNRKRVDGEDLAMIKFDGLLAIVVGLFILYIVAMYCIDVGVRYAQLLFLQVLAPVAIISYISPKKDGMFQKWTKQCITTYIDLFIRLAIIYFVLLIVSVLSEAFISGTLFAKLGELNWFLKLLCYIALILGLLLFAQKAPKLLQELFPNSGAAGMGFGLNAKDRLNPGINAVKGAWGAGKRTVGGAAGAIYGAHRARKEGKALKEAGGEGAKGIGLWGGMKAAYRGLKAGAAKEGGLRKGLDAAIKSVDEDVSTVKEGGRPLEKDFRSHVAITKKKTVERTAEELEETIKSKKSVSETLNETKVSKMISGVKDSKVYKENAAWRDQFDGKAKEVEKAAREFAVADTPEKKAAAKVKLADSVKDAILGSGLISASAETAIRAEKVTKLSTAMIDGKLSEKQITELSRNNVIDSSIQGIISKPPTERTSAEQATLRNFITTNEQTLAANVEGLREANAFAETKIDQNAREWEITGHAIQESIRIAKGSFGTLQALVGENNMPKFEVVRNGTKQSVPIEDLEPEEFARVIGDVENAAKIAIGQIKDNDEHRANVANSRNIQ